MKKCALVLALALSSMAMIFTGCGGQTNAGSSGTQDEIVNNVTDTDDVNTFETSEENMAIDDSWITSGEPVYYGGSSWDNQALFAHDGTALESLKTFGYVYTGTVCET